MSWLPSIFGASLLGSLHCVGMCGGLVGFYAGSDPAARGRQLGLHAAYHLSRLAAYLVLGAAAGQLGAAVDLAGDRAGLGKLAAGAAGLVMIAWGLGALWRARKTPGLLTLERSGRARGSRRLLGWLESRLAATLARLRGRRPLPRAALLGLATGLLPCGWLYAFVVLAAGTGHWHAGALTMLAFWLGGLPALLGLAVGVRYLAVRWGRLVPQLSAALLVAFGVASLWSHFPSLAEAHSDGPPPACHAVD